MGCIFIHFFGRPAAGRAGANFHYTIPTEFCQEKICTNFDQKIFPILCILPIVFLKNLWYTIIVNEREMKPLSHPPADYKMVTKNFKKKSLTNNKNYDIIYL